jgi:Domain of unknown function (DUF4189)
MFFDLRMRLLALFIIMLAVSAESSAQNGVQGICGPGYVQYEVAGGGYSCAPAPGQAPPGVAAPRWETRWGAIATGGSAFGYAQDMPSKRKAEKAALQQCKSKAGQKCEIATSFYNQCGALAIGDASGAYGAGADIATSNRLAMTACSKQTTNCKVHYSACSYPRQIN